MSKSVLGSIRRASRRVQSGGRGLRIVVFAWLLALLTCAGALAQGAYPVFGIHFWSPSASEGNLQIQNGRPMWTVEMLYTEDVRTWSYSKFVETRNHFARIKSYNFRIILRVDYSPTSTIPRTGDYSAKTSFALWCGQIAYWLGPYCHAMIIGNEIKGDNPSISADWYARVFNSPDPNDQWTVYRQVKTYAPNLLVGIYAPSGWPSQQDIYFWRSVVYSVKRGPDGLPQIDCFPLHAYSGASTTSEKFAENPRFSSIYDFNSFTVWMTEIYSLFGTTRPVYITETNTYWYYGPWGEDAKHSEKSYRPYWLREAFTAIDCWNKANDIKVCALCWYVWHAQCTDDKVCDQIQNSLEREDNELLNAARYDYWHVTKYRYLTPGDPGGPIRIQFEHYTNSDVRDGRGWFNAMEDVDYRDTTSGNIGGWFRNDGVDIMRDANGGHFVYRTSPGEWLRYDSLFGGQRYKWRVCFARPYAGTSRVRLQIDRLGRFELALEDPDQKGETFHVAESRNSVYLEPGRHEMKVLIRDGQVYLDWFELVPVTGGPQ